MMLYVDVGYGLVRSPVEDEFSVSVLDYFKPSIVGNFGSYRFVVKFLV